MIKIVKGHIGTYGTKENTNLSHTTYLEYKIVNLLFVELLLFVIISLS